MSYRITQRLSGELLCEVTIQDGTERWVERGDIELAKRSVKQAAKTWNGVKIKKRDIEIYREVVPAIARPEIVRVNPS